MSDTEVSEKRRKFVMSDDESDTEAAPSTVHESVRNEQEEAGLDDLFGDDDEEVVDQADQTGIAAGSDEEDFLRDDDDEGAAAQFTVHEEVKQRELRVDNLDIVRHPPKFKEEANSTIFHAKIPTFLQVNPARFDGTDYLRNLEISNKKLDVDEIELSKLIDENTIRWRFTKESNASLTAESNAQIVEWEDGSLSLKLGDEIFDILETDLIDTGLLTSQGSIEDSKTPTVFLSDGLVQKSLKFVPTSTNSAIHKKLTSAIRSRHQAKRPGAQSVLVETDPEKVAKRLEKEMEDKIRERRRQELKLEKERLGSAGSTQSNSVSSRYSQQQQPRDEYDDEDDFLDDNEDAEDDLEDVDEGDDDEDDLAAERLKRIKAEGASKYKQSESDEENDEEGGRSKSGQRVADEHGDVDDDDDDEATPGATRKKRRVIEDDEDDE